MRKVLGAYHRLKSFVDTQEKLGEQVFPNAESKEAWNELREYFENYRCEPRIKRVIRFAGKEYNGNN